MSDENYSVQVVRPDKRLSAQLSAVINMEIHEDTDLNQIIHTLVLVPVDEEGPVILPKGTYTFRMEVNVLEAELVEEEAVPGPRGEEVCTPIEVNADTELDVIAQMDAAQLEAGYDANGMYVGNDQDGFLDKATEVTFRRPWTDDFDMNGGTSTEGVASVSEHLSGPGVTPERLQNVADNYSTHAPLDAQASLQDIAHPETPPEVAADPPPRRAGQGKGMKRVAPRFSVGTPPPAIKPRRSRRA